MGTFILIALFVLFVLVSVLFYMFHNLRQEVRDKMERYGKAIDSLNTLPEKMSVVWDALRCISGYELKRSFGTYYFERIPDDKRGDSIDKIFTALDLILEKLGYTFQPPTKQPAKLVKIEKKEDKDAKKQEEAK